MMRFRLGWAIVAALIVAPHARAQTSPLLEPGERLRVQVEDRQRYAGDFTGIADERLRIDTSDKFRLEFTLAGIDRLQVLRGRDRARGFTVGGAIGGMGGLLAGAVISVLGIPRDTGANLAVIGVPLVTFPAGAVLGALIGTPRYVDVSVNRP